MSKTHKSETRGAVSSTALVGLSHKIKKLLYLSAIILICRFGYAHGIAQIPKATPIEEPETAHGEAAVTHDVRSKLDVNLNRTPAGGIQATNPFSEMSSQRISKSHFVFGDREPVGDESANRGSDKSENNRPKLQLHGVLIGWIVGMLLMIYAVPFCSEYIRYRIWCKKWRGAYWPNDPSSPAAAEGDGGAQKGGGK